MDQSVGSSRGTSVLEKSTQGGKTPRRFWTPLEEEALIDALKSLRAAGWKCDGSFRGGYMVRLEKMMLEKFPNRGIMVKHIKSKLQVWKKDYALILGILGSSGGAGASIDPATNMIVADSESVWTEYIKVHPAASKLRGRPQPLYNSWVEIFGNDRAQGTGAVDIGDALNDLLYGSQNNGTEICGDNMLRTPSNSQVNAPDEPFDDEISTTPPVGGTRPNKSSASSSKRKRNTPSTQDIESLVGSWMENTSTALGSLVEKINHQVEMAVRTSVNESEDRRALYEALSEIPDLSLHDRVLAARRLAHSQADRDVFWGMSKEARCEFGHVLLSERMSP